MLFASPSVKRLPMNTQGHEGVVRFGQGVVRYGASGLWCDLDRGVVRFGQGFAAIWALIRRI